MKPCLVGFLSSRFCFVNFQRFLFTKVSWKKEARDRREREREEMMMKFFSSFFFCLKVFNFFLSFLEGRFLKCFGCSLLLQARTAKEYNVCSVDQSLVWFGLVWFVLFCGDDIAVVEMFVAVASMTKARKDEFPFVQGGFFVIVLIWEKKDV
jgi:hypothetical protein